jgi:Family of unknown function (DUF6064)
VTPLPFSREEFLDVFAAYNTAVWPAAAILWFASLVGVVQLVRGRAQGTGLGALLAVHWAWSGAAYHARFFAEINPAAWLFAALFLIQGALFAWTGVVRRQLQFAWRRSPRHALAGGLLLFALAYPGLALLMGHDWPRTPTFGVPCPTTALTAGLLLAAVPSVAPWLIIIPVLWSLVGGSAALLLGVVPDLGLLVAGLGLILAARTPRALHRPSAE